MLVLKNPRKKDYNMTPKFEAKDRSHASSFVTEAIEQTQIPISISQNSSPRKNIG